MTLKTKNMKKREAIQAMQDGKKVTHRFLVEEKFMQLNKSGLYEFSDGRKCDPVLFWKLRGLYAEWVTGWSLYETKTLKQIQCANTPL